MIKQKLGGKAIMKHLKLSILFLGATVFAAACNQSQSDNVYTNPNDYRNEQGASVYDNNARFARENLNLRAVGSLIEKADNAEEFEYLLNDSDNGVNNLDLNGDGYADYISVREFDDRSSNQRGFSLFDMFGPDQIQEIATLLFDRQGANYPGARALLTGNDQLYGDNNYYETNLLDRTIPLVSWLFGNRDSNYSSPYYYENYPNSYEPYRTVETPAYISRIQEYYPAPVFVQTAQPTVTQVNVVSPYDGRTYDRIYSKLAKPTKEQIQFVKTNPRPEFIERNKDEKQKDFSAKKDKSFNDNQNRFEKFEKFKQERSEFRQQEKREKPEKMPRMKDQPQNQQVFERREQQKVERRNDEPRMERQNQPKMERQNQPQFERPNMKPPKQEMREQPKGNPNDGGGKGKGNGGGNGGGGNGKGKGKG